MISYGPREKERVYPRDAWPTGWHPIPLALLPEDFDDKEEVHAIISSVQRCGKIDTGCVLEPHSGDSWRAFSNRNRLLTGRWDWDSETRTYRRWDQKEYSPPKSRYAQNLQEKWEQERLAAQQAKQAEADRLWAEEEKRRRDERAEISRVANERWAAEEKQRLEGIQSDLSAIAAEALKQFLHIRKPGCAGTAYLGPKTSGVRFHYPGVSLLTVVEALANEVPRHAQLSAYKLEVPHGVAGASWTEREASLRVRLNPADNKMSFEVTWT